MKPLLLIIILIIIIPIVADGWETERITYLRQYCTTCGGDGVVLDWDSIKTAMVKSTPKEDWRYKYCKTCNGTGKQDFDETTEKIELKRLTQEGKIIK